MKAAVLRAFGEPFSLEEVTLAPPGPGEVEVEIRACAICHSDIIYADGGWGGTLPMVLGHEAAGVVGRVGPGVTHAAPGDAVVVTLIRACGECRACGRGEEVLCESSFPLDEVTPLTGAGGEEIVQGLRTGAFAERVVVHESQLARIPADVDFAAASLVACGVLTGYGAVVNTARLRAGDSAVVIGCGGVGLNAIQGAVAVNAGIVIAVDVAAGKLEEARRLGATHTVDASEEDTSRTVLGHTDGRGADAVFVTVGSGAVISGAPEMLARGGQVVVVGMPASGVMSSFEPASLAGSGQRILGAKMGSAVVSRDVPMLIERYRQGGLELDALVTRRWPLERINDAVEAARSGKGVRQVIVFANIEDESNGTRA